MAFRIQARNGHLFHVEHFDCSRQGSDLVARVDALHGQPAAAASTKPSVDATKAIERGEGARDDDTGAGQPKLLDAAVERMQVRQSEFGGSLPYEGSLLGDGIDAGHLDFGDRDGDHRSRETRHRCRRRSPMPSWEPPAAAAPPPSSSRANAAPASARAGAVPSGCRPGSNVRAGRGSRAARRAATARGRRRALRRRRRARPLVRRHRSSRSAGRFFFRWTSSSETAAGVTPEMRDAWPSVAGRCAASFCRTS